ncbi:MAG: DUF1801 domain-containing protein [Roseovarius sp.]|nr:DUF1801 domain-containing protein [Roseovarius sp.]
MSGTIPPEVARVIDGYAQPTRDGVHHLRRLILQTAKATPEVGPVEETLRWGQPAYLTRKGSTLRIGPHRDASFALFAHCQSTIIASYAQAFPSWDQIDGNRAVLFDSPNQIEPQRLSHLIRHALSYHVTKSPV